MFFNKQATFRCVIDSLTPTPLGCPTSGINRDRALKSGQPRSIGCEIERKAAIQTSQWEARENILSSDFCDFNTSEEDESSSEIILQTETTGLGPFQIFSYSLLNPIRSKMLFMSTVSPLRTVYITI